MSVQHSPPFKHLLNVNTVLGMQTRDWFSHSKELALSLGDIPSSESAGHLFHRAPAPQQVGIDILMLDHFLGSQPQLPTVLITAPGAEERKKAMVFAHLTTLNRTFQKCLWLAVWLSSSQQKLLPGIAIALRSCPFQPLPFNRLVP